MTDGIERAAQILCDRVRIYYNQWKVDPHGFHVAHPEIIVSIDSHFRAQRGALDSIASHIMGGTGFDYHIAEVLGGDPVFFVGMYDERRVQR